MKKELIEEVLGATEAEFAEHPGYADVCYRMGILFAAVGQAGDSLKMLDRALGINPDYVEPAMTKCFMLGMVGREDEGFRLFKRIHVRSPHDLRVLLNLGIYCMRHGWIRCGVSLIHRVAAQRPTIPYLQAYAAAAAGEQADAAAEERFVDAARGACREGGLDVGESFPDMDLYRYWEPPCIAMDVRYILAEYAVRIGDFPAAREHLMFVHENFPGHVPTLVGLGELAIAEGDVDTAREWFRKAAHVDEDSHVAAMNLGLALLDAGEVEEAVAMMERAICLRPLFPDYRYHIACALEAAGRVQEAVYHLEKALVINPNYDVARLSLARALVELGEFDRVVELLEGTKVAEWNEGKYLLARALEATGQELRAERLRAELEEAELETEAEESDETD